MEVRPIRSQSEETISCSPCTTFRVQSLLQQFTDKRVDRCVVLGGVDFGLADEIRRKVKGYIPIVHMIKCTTYNRTRSVDKFRPCSNGFRINLRESN
jgi:hypothetical protein